jgi:drug/metabolite transporter (DMT)-like permease
MPGVALILMSASCYGMSVPFARAAALSGVPGPQMAVLRTAFTLCCIGPAIRWLGNGVHVPVIERRSLLLLGLVSAVLSLAYLSAVTLIPVGVAVTIFYTFPLLILIASPLLEKARFTRQRLALFVTAFAGIVAAIGPSFQSLDWRGLVLAMVASVAAATQFFIAARAPGGGGLVTIFWMNMVMLPIALVVSLVFGSPTKLALATAALPATLSVLFYAVGVVSQMRGLRMTSATTGGLVFCLEPIVATLSATVILNEHLTLSQYTGGAIVLGVIATSIATGGVRHRP